MTAVKRARCDVRRVDLQRILEIKGLICRFRFKGDYKGFFFNKLHFVIEREYEVVECFFMDKLFGDYIVTRIIKRINILLIGFIL